MNDSHRSHPNRTAGNGVKYYVPYRASTLTRLLQGSLGGTSRTVLICTVSPSGKAIEQVGLILQSHWVEDVQALKTDFDTPLCPPSADQGNDRIRVKGPPSKKQCFPEQNGKSVAD